MLQCTQPRDRARAAAGQCRAGGLAFQDGEAKLPGGAMPARPMHTARNAATATSISDCSSNLPAMMADIIDLQNVVITFTRRSASRQKFREPNMPAQFKIFMANQHHDEGKLRIPVMQEELHIGKRTVETGKGVRLNKTVSEEVWRIDDTLNQQTLDIQHIPVNAWVVGDAPTRYA